MDEVPAKRREGAGQKFAACLARLRKHCGVPWVEATHVEQDRQCPIGDARLVLRTLSERQEELGLPSVAMRVVRPEGMDSRPGSRANRTFHDYMKASFMRREFFVALLGGEAPDPEMDPPLETPCAVLAPHLPSAAPPSTLCVSDFSVDVGELGWEDRAFEIFSASGFVVVESVLKLHQCMQVLSDCDKAAEEIIRNEPSGNRGNGRYSFGKSSVTGSMLHVPSYAKHLLEAACGTLRPFLDLLFAAGDGGGDGGKESALPASGFICTGGGGDFVVGGETDFQPLHSDIHVSKAQDVHLPPPVLSVNFCVQPLTNDNGAMRIIPGKRDASAAPSPEPGEWRRSRLCPLPLGTAIVRDVRTIHGGTPNYTAETRFLPSIEFASAAFRATNRSDKFPPPRCLPHKLYERLPPEVQEVCEELAVPKGSSLQAGFWKRTWKRADHA
uniref:Uncharacterized protein n=1 Tax=Alexandrium catenella TaxID=2925 RepID=A0A7S1W5J0_ALECA|mmetsp:Transcript_40143/g.108424  ORF Transcript_40143/g.108424 Transcript_40143/m.108424 type:complete len:442 (+) Transcript_40143:2-1327(+)